MVLPSARRFVVALLLAAVPAACAGDDSTGTAERSSTPPADSSVPTMVATTARDRATSELPSIELRIATDHVAFTLDHDGSLSVAEMRDPAKDPGCGTTTAFFSGARDFRIEAVPSGCDLPAPAEPGNGDHGIYRTIDDVAQPVDIERLDTPLGPAVLFSQTYVECTNYCEDFVEPVAIVTIDDPVDPDYPTLVVRSDKGEFDRAELRAMVETLTPPD